MIIFLSLYIVAGLAWYFFTLLSSAFTAFGGSPSTIYNPVLRTFYSWYMMGDIPKNIVGIPLWIGLWPIWLSAVLIAQQIKKSGEK